MHRFYIRDLHFNPDDCKWGESDSSVGASTFAIGFDRKKESGSLLPEEMEKLGWSIHNCSWKTSLNTPRYIQTIVDSFYKKCHISILKQTSGNSMPLHVDRYYRFRKQFDPENKRNLNDVIRLIINLGEWESGHYLEYDYEPITKWKKGDGYIFEGNIPHLSMGNTPKYTMQLTGFREDFNERAL